MSRTLLRLTLALGLLAPALSWARGVTLGNLPGKYVPLKQAPNVAGLKQTTKMNGVDAGFIVFTGPHGGIKYAQTYADGGILKGAFYKKVGSK